MLPILLALAFIAILIFILIAGQPDEFIVTRAANFSAPPDKIFPHVNNLHLWEAEVDSADVSRLIDFFQMFEAVPDELPNMRNKLVLGVQGYNDDSREVYEIPEVRDWFSKAEKEVLGWGYYLLLESEFSTFSVFFFCTCKLELQGFSIDGTHKILLITYAEGSAFLERHFDWLNQFTEKHQIPLSVNKEISLAMGKAARQWFNIRPNQSDSNAISPN